MFMDAPHQLHDLKKLQMSAKCPLIYIIQAMILMKHIWKLGYKMSFFQL